MADLALVGLEAMGAQAGEDLSAQELGEPDRKAVLDCLLRETADVSSAITSRFATLTQGFTVSTALLGAGATLAFNSQPAVFAALPLLVCAVASYFLQVITDINAYSVYRVRLEEEAKLLVGVDLLRLHRFVVPRRRAWRDPVVLLLLAVYAAALVVLIVLGAQAPITVLQHWLYWALTGLGLAAVAAAAWGLVRSGAAVERELGPSVVEAAPRHAAPDGASAALAVQAHRPGENPGSIGDGTGITE